MWKRTGALSLVALTVAQQASAQPITADIQMLAQAYDRCMTTYAVRLSDTSAKDDDIFAKATEGCAGLDAQVRAGLSRQLPAATAAQFLTQLDANAKPSFMRMLARIRADNASGRFAIKP